jgi:ATP-binding cassette subfamily C protein
LCRNHEGGPVSARRRLATAFLRDLGSFAGRRGRQAVALAIAAAFVEAAAFMLVAPLLAVLAGAALPARLFGRWLARFGLASPVALLVAVLTAIGLLWVARCLLVWTRDSRLSSLTTDFAEAQRRRIVTGLAAAPWSHVAAMDATRIAHVLGQDVMRIALAAQVLVQALVAGVMLGALTVTALLLAPLLAAIALALLAIAGLGIGRLLRRAHDVGTLVARSNLHLAEVSSRFLGGLRFAASQNLQQGFVSRFDAGLDAVRAQQGDYLRQQGAARLLLSSVALLVGAAVAVIGQGWLEMPLPTLGALILVLSRLGGPIAQIQQTLQQLFFALPAYDQLNALADDIGAPLAPVAAPAVRVSLPGDASLHLDGVDYAYPPRHAGTPSRPVLSGASLTLAPGEMLGLTGVSGAGKSTLADIILGLLTPMAGQVRIGTVPLVGAAAAAWREQIAYATQEPFLFRDTLRMNLTWGTPAADDAAIWAALEAAEMAETVRAWPDGLEVVIGDRGSALSGGERQRLALARALLRGGRLLLLDEATSAIDIETEAIIFNRLRTGSTARSILVIAHRAETLGYCDRVVRLVDGRIEPVR